MNSRHLCIDIDNVVAETDPVIRELIRKHTRGRVNLRYEDVVEYDYRQCKDSKGNKINEEEWNIIHGEFSEEKYILGLAPYPGVQDRLHTLFNIGFQIHFVSSRLPQARIPTIEWLEKHRFPDHRLHFVKHRERHLVLGKFFAVIEDDLQQARDFVQTGTPVYLIAHPWNVTGNTGTVFRANNWKEIFEQLQNKY